jgi:hypothetical protein
VFFSKLVWNEIEKLFLHYIDKNPQQNHAPDNHSSPLHDCR